MGRIMLELALIILVISGYWCGSTGGWSAPNSSGPLRSIWGDNWGREEHEYWGLDKNDRGWVGENESRSGSSWPRSWPGKKPREWFCWLRAWICWLRVWLVCWLRDCWLIWFWLLCCWLLVWFWFNWLCCCCGLVDPSAREAGKGDKAPRFQRYWKSWAKQLRYNWVIP